MTIAKRLAALGLLLLASMIVSPAIAAGIGSITYKDAGGTTRTYDIWTMTSGNYQGMVAICDTAAEGQCATVDIGGNLIVKDTAAGTLLTQLNLGQNSTTSGQTGPLMQGAVTTNPPTYNDGKTSPISIDPTGAVRVTGGVSAGSTTSGQTMSLLGCGVTTAPQSYTNGQTNFVNCDPDGGVRVVPIPPTSGGLSTYSGLISAATTNATSVKSSGGLLCGFQASNTNAAARYLKFYNKASAPTVGTDVPYMAPFLIPPNSSGIIQTFPFCVNFPTGIAFATTTGVANSDTGAVAANEIIVNIFRN